jgi:hypothetical protein
MGKKEILDDGDQSLFQSSISMTVREEMNMAGSISK